MPARMRFVDLLAQKRPAGRRGDEGVERDHAFQRAILAIPAGKVSTYGKIAEAAGYPRYHRAVARMLRNEPSDRLPWHRIVGADGALKTTGDSAREQRGRLRLEGVVFRGARVDLSVSLHQGGDLAGG